MKGRKEQAAVSVFITGEDRGLVWSGRREGQSSGQQKRYCPYNHIQHNVPIISFNCWVHSL